MHARVAVIGAGIGGLTSAALLAARGADVIVLEKEAWVGGKARRVEVDGAAIDGGPTVFTYRAVFDEVFAACGAQLDDHVTARRAEVIARHAWDDGGHLDLFADPEASAAAVAAFAGEDAARGYRAFAAEAARIFGVLEEPFLRGDKASTPLPMMWRIGPWRIGDALAMRPFDGMWTALGEHFADPRLRQLFGRYATYCGSSPFAAPATLMLIAHLEARGVWLIEGGIHALAKALAGLAERQGARVRTGAPVAEILTAQGRASGVRLASGEVIPADIVICNGDPGALATGRFGEAAARAVPAIPQAKRSLSALVWYAHAETRGFELTHHNVFFSRDYPREFREIAAGGTPSEPTVYVCAIDRDAQLGAPAPQGRERLQIIVNAPADGDVHTYTPEERERCTRAMIATLKRCGLQLEDPLPHRLMTPQDWEHLFPATGGALYGRASHGWAASFQRQGPKTRLPGLYCTGGATHPAAGVPMAALSGQLAARVIAKDLASTRTSPRAATAGGMSTRSATTGSTG
ncbi:1-hydroxycarotenoid 3,4-desaturase CrtD [Porphyrobacter sp. CACIAM 03H1]|uniref:1-hydroxycarotenoid 3,4-desaturase CrtD n=1 Tax=Porphyrobacter sp. CACIAM 03H1 TaxID=2003315 RepID=UPI000B5AAE82|nr:1-hydroxycarotenoid 3,4-desaturase CrtD [Porphyrobacter sp. CACIAM 03H1]ASJ92091.1 CrtD protein [Porphyrobacter sp. CACIAM 03H1]